MSNFKKILKLFSRTNFAAKKPARQLRWRLIGVVLIALLPSFLLVLVVLYNLRNDLISNSERSVYQIANQISSHQVNLEKSTSQLMVALSQVPSIQYTQPEACDDQLHSIVMKIPFYLNLAIANSSGIVLCSGVPLNGSLNVSQDQFFESALSSPKAPLNGFNIYPQLTIDPIVRSEAIIFGQKISFINGSPGVIFASLNLDYMSNLVHSLKLPPNSFAGIVSPTGVLLYDGLHPNSALVGGQMFPGSIFNSKSISASGGIFSVSGDDGTNRIYAAAPFGGPNAQIIGYAVVGVAHSQVDMIPNHDIKLTIIGISIAALIAILGAILIGSRAFKKIQQRAVQDELTGLFNRAYGLELAEREFKRFQRLGDPLSVMIMDLDFFKRINDTYGHQVGDIVLTSVANAIKEGCRAVDIVVRHGGEEFLVVLPNADRLDATEVGERIRLKVASSHIKTKRDIKINMTVSIGLAEAHRGMDSLDKLIAKADEALYRAKDNGRNQVILADWPV